MLASIHPLARCQGAGSHLHHLHGGPAKGKGKGQFIKSLLIYQAHSLHKLSTLLSQTTLHRKSFHTHFRGEENKPL